MNKIRKYKDKKQLNIENILKKNKEQLNNLKKEHLIILKNLQEEQLMDILIIHKLDFMILRLFLLINKNIRMVNIYSNLAI